MTNPIYNPQPNYSGVTIQIANPAVYANGACQYPKNNMDNYTTPPILQQQQQQQLQQLQNNIEYSNSYDAQQATPKNYVTNPQIYNPATLPYSTNSYSNNAVAQPLAPQNNAYPPQYYLNNYNYQYNQPNPQNSSIPNENQVANNSNNIPNYQDLTTPQEKQINPMQNAGGVEENKIDLNSYREALKTDEAQDFTKSNDIIANLDDRIAEAKTKKENSTQKNIIALTDEYIKSLENYLNNPNDDIRVMASKEILKRLDEDKDRKDDAALNALLNKMMQDPSKIVRVAALSAFNSGLATGNDYTVKLLHDIQNNPNSDKEDVLQAADILLKFSAGEEVKNIPNPQIKDDEKKQKE